jgi:hypothetical protein
MTPGFAASTGAPWAIASSRLPIASAIAPLNPALSPDEVDILARFISASLEGTTIFAGHGKPWAHQMPQLKALAVTSLVQLAKTITPAEIQRFA